LKISKKYDEEPFSLEMQDNILSEFGKGDVPHPDVLTPDEILNSEKKKTTKNNALNSLLKRMTKNTSEKKGEDEVHPTTDVTAEILKFSKVTLDINTPEHSATTAPQTVFTEEKSETIEAEKAEIEPQVKSSLLDKCMPYILDEDGNDTSVNSEPLYKLESVAEILKADSEKTLEKLSKEYGISFENASLEIPKSEDFSEETKLEEPPETIDYTKLEIEPLQPKAFEATADFQISDIDIPNSTVKKIKTVGDIVKFLEKNID